MKNRNSIGKEIARELRGGNKIKPNKEPLVAGDIVLYYAVLDGRHPPTRHEVRRVINAGIPSCREPMVLLEGRPGVILQSHCFKESTTP